MIENRRLCLAVDDVKFVKGGVGREIELGKDNAAPNRRPHNRTVIAEREILSKRFPAARFAVVMFMRLDLRSREDALPAFF